MADMRMTTFAVTDQQNVPTGRRGKHRDIVTQIFDALDGLPTGKALKIPLVDLPDTKVNIRSALSRAARKNCRAIGTAADDGNLYIWNA